MSRYSLLENATQPNRAANLPSPPPIIHCLARTRSLSFSFIISLSLSRSRTPSHLPPLPHYQRTPDSNLPPFQLRASTLARPIERESTACDPDRIRPCDGVDAVLHPRLRDPGEPVTKWPTAYLIDSRACPLSTSSATLASFSSLPRRTPRVHLHLDALSSYRRLLFPFFFASLFLCLLISLRLLSMSLLRFPSLATLLCALPIALRCPFVSFFFSQFFFFSRSPSCSIATDMSSYPSARLCR